MDGSPVNLYRLILSGSSSQLTSQGVLRPLQYDLSMNTLWVWRRRRRRRLLLERSSCQLTTYVKLRAKWQGHRPYSARKKKLDSDVEIDKFSAFSINYGDHSGIGMFHLFGSDWNFKFNHKRLCRCFEVKFFYTLFNDPTRGSIANNFVYCRCLQILYQITFFYKI